MAISDSPISASFGKPFSFQVAAFRLRLAELKATTGWDKEVWQAEHDRAFMVAGAIRADILADLAAAVDKAISQGTTLETFRKDFRKIVAEKGWQISHAGQGTKGGEAWRTKVIYKTNLSTSYAAGRFAQLTQAGYPFLVYRHGAAVEPRIQHLAWDGLVLPADHPFWKTHCPPNGWGCTCYITGARSKESARRVGGKPEKALPEGWQAPDPKTGAPVGIDRGWGYAPGASAAADIGWLAAKPLNWDFNLAVAYMKSVPAANRDLLSTSYRDLPSFKAMMRTYVERVASGPPAATGLPELKTLGLASEELRGQIFRLVGKDDAPDLYDFIVDQSAIRHVLVRHSNAKVELSRGQRPIIADDFARLGELLNKPDLLKSGDPMVGHPQVVVIEKQFGDERLITVFEVRGGRRRIALVSMWVESKAGAPSTITP
jgi:hypothetical protein